MEGTDIVIEWFASNNRGQAIDGYHQMVTYNVQANSKFKMNSGFVDETMNETFKQLLLSLHYNKNKMNTFFENIIYPSGC